MNPLKKLEEFGQSVWFDYIRRNLLLGNGLERLIKEDGLKGMTSNPAIFQKAIAGSTDYAQALEVLGHQQGMTPEQAYESLALEDIRTAADRLRPVFDATNGRDGFISLEVSPRLANDTQQTLQEARRLWTVLDKPNVMIKVPATKAGLPAIETLLAEGINVNITLLFSNKVYEQVAEAYIRAMEKRVGEGKDPATVASVASFFISRIETAVDNLIAERLDSDVSDEQRQQLKSIEGQVAVANAKLAYQRYQQLFTGDRWQALKDQGAQTQRLLWASTSVKNPAYRDVRYIEELIGVDTVNTVPPATMDAFRDHGIPRPASLEEDVEGAQRIMETVEKLEISMDEITDQLLMVGVRKFVDAFDKLLGSVEKALATTNKQDIDTFSYTLGDELSDAVASALDDWQSNNKVQRLWSRDARLWTGKDEAQWLDWLDITEAQLDHLGDSRHIFHALQGRDYKHAILLGMGGSSMGPEVFRKTFGSFSGYPDLHVLDSTDPAEVKAMEDAVDLPNTIFLVASKSGSTLEPNILMAYFFQRMCDSVGAENAPGHFAAITDPGSNLEKEANAKGFRRLFYGKPHIGGRYSVLSNFGIVPAAIMGVDVGRLLGDATEMVEACAACVPARENPGVVLGCILGTAANLGYDKLTIVASPGIDSLGAWLEQLIAESTCKQGKGIIPVDGEDLGMPEVYGSDRLFAYLRLATAPDAAQDAAIDRLEQSGQPVVRIHVNEIENLGQEFFRWEIATAVAGSILEINPFDQPDVEASKIETRLLTEQYETAGALPPESPFAQDDGIALYTDERNAAALRQSVGEHASVAELIKAHLQRAGGGDYVTLLAYLARNKAHDQELQSMRNHLRDTRHTATCVGFGPRFLHSTGQGYKGGPNSGVFIQITCDNGMDLPVPGKRYTFGIVKAAQARGDFQVLVARERRALRVHLGADTVAGLQQLRKIIEGVGK